MTAQRSTIQHAIQKLVTPSYVPPVATPDVSPFTLGRRAAEANLAPNQAWPPRVVAGWQFEVAERSQSGESFVISH